LQTTNTGAQAKMAKPAYLAYDGADPRMFDQLEKHSTPAADDSASTAIKPQQRALHDRDVTFEEYYYYAQQTRAEELTHPKTGHETSIWSLIFPSKSDTGVQQSDEAQRNLSIANVRAYVSDEEWANASRALRTATRGAAFYLITTDILGPFALPFAFATMGWG